MGSRVMLARLSARLRRTTPEERAVLHAATVWAVARASRCDGEVYHQACRALSDAVRVMNGEDVPDATEPPTRAALEAGVALVRRLRARSRPPA